MKGIEILEGLEELKTEYNKQGEDNPLSPLYVENDEAYPNKYRVIFSLLPQIENVSDGTVYEQMLVLDVNEEYEYSSTYHVYIKMKENGQPLGVYYNNFVKGIPDNGNGFVIDFLNTLLYINH